MKPNSPVRGGLGGRALATGWTVTVTNAGPVPVLGVEIGCNDESEGRPFDWQPEENAPVLLPVESRSVPKALAVRALAVGCVCRHSLTDVCCPEGQLPFGPSGRNESLTGS